MHGDYYLNKRFSEEYQNEMSVYLVYMFLIIVIAAPFGIRRADRNQSACGGQVTNPHLKMEDGQRVEIKNGELRIEKSGTPTEGPSSAIVLDRRYVVATLCFALILTAITVVFLLVLILGINILDSSKE